MSKSPASADTLALTCDLIRRPSVSPDDHGCLQLIGERLQAVGFEVERMPFGPVENLFHLPPVRNELLELFG